MEITGGCHCGNIRYRAKADPENTLICHCTDCQAMSGTVFRTIAFVSSDDFELIQGELKVYVKVADSGNRRAMNFCADCGSHIYACDVGENPETLGIRLGTCDQRSQIIPRKQYYTESAMPWLDQLGKAEAS